MSDLYDLILFGKLKDGADPADVKVRLAKVLKIDEAKAEALISSGKNTRLRSSPAQGSGGQVLQGALFHRRDLQCRA